MPVMAADFVVVTRHRGVRWDDRSGEYRKRDQGKKRIAKHLHGE